MITGASGVLAWDESRRAHLALLTATGAPPAPYRAREQAVEVYRVHDPRAVLRQLIDFFNDDPCQWQDGECVEHMAGTVDGVCTVVAARHTLDGLERAGLLIIPEEAVAQASGSEPPEPPLLADQITLAQLWETLDNDKHEVLQGVVAKANSASRAERHSARRIVAAAVQEWFEGGSDA